MILVYLNLVYKWYKWRVGIIPVNAGIFTTYSGQHELEPEYQQFIFRCFLLELEILYWYPVPVCNASPSDEIHLLSGDCPALFSPLARNLSNGLQLLSNFPCLFDAAVGALNSGAETWTKFFVNPSTDPKVISYSQEFGRKSLFPVFRLN